MLVSNVFQSPDGDWLWEVLDEDELYIRSSSRFPEEKSARDDLGKQCHLIQALFKIN